MWIAFVAGWILGSAALYAYLVNTAKEPQHDECMDCHLPECTDCPHLIRPKEALKRAA